MARVRLPGELGYSNHFDPLSAIGRPGRVCAGIGCRRTRGIKFKAVGRHCFRLFGGRESVPGAGQDNGAGRDRVLSLGYEFINILVNYVVSDH